MPSAQTIRLIARALEDVFPDEPQICGIRLSRDSAGETILSERPHRLIDPKSEGANRLKAAVEAELGSPISLNFEDPKPEPRPDDPSAGGVPEPRRPMPDAPISSTALDTSTELATDDS